MNHLVSHNHVLEMFIHKVVPASNKSLTRSLSLLRYNLYLFSSSLFVWALSGGFPVGQSFNIVHNMKCTTALYLSYLHDVSPPLETFPFILSLSLSVTLKAHLLSTSRVFVMTSHAKTRQDTTEDHSSSTHRAALDFDRFAIDFTTQRIFSFFSRVAVLSQRTTVARIGCVI